MSRNFSGKVCLFLLAATLCLPQFQPAPPKAWARTSLKPLADPPPISGSNWQLIFSDDFDGNTLNSAFWSKCDLYPVGSNGCVGNQPGEMSIFQPDDVLVENGMVRLRAQQRTVVADGKTFTVTSGIISQRDKFSFTYGYIEARMRISQGRGLWPGFFTLPVRRRTWPFQPPEIDIMENVGTEPNVVHQFYHYPDVNLETNWDARQAWNFYRPGWLFANSWHVYAALWEPDRIVFYVDGVEVLRVTRDITDEPAYIISTHSVGTIFSDNHYFDSTSVFPAYSDIDYVRVWQRQPVQATATATATALAPTSTRTPTSTPTSTPTPTSTSTSTPLPAPTATGTAAPASTATKTPTAIATTSVPPPTHTAAPTTRPTNTPSPTPSGTDHTLNSIIDPLSSLTTIHQYSNASQFDIDDSNSALFGGDSGRLLRATTSSQWVTWALTNVQLVTATAYFWPSESAAHFTFAYSSDNANFTAISPTITDLGGNWRQVRYALHLPSAANFVRVIFPQTVNGWTPQLGHIALSSTKTPALLPKLYLPLLRRTG
jgi:beta-glucanase (GH16 family)